MWQVEFRQTLALSGPHSLNRDRQNEWEKYVVYEKCCGGKENRIRTTGSRSWGSRLKREIGESFSEKGTCQQGPEEVRE